MRLGGCQEALLVPPMGIGANSFRPLLVAVACVRWGADRRPVHGKACSARACFVLHQRLPCCEHRTIRGRAQVKSPVASMAYRERPWRRGSGQWPCVPLSPCGGGRQPARPDPATTGLCAVPALGGQRTCALEIFCAGSLHPAFFERRRGAGGHSCRQGCRARPALCACVPLPAIRMISARQWGRVQ